VDGNDDIHVYGMKNTVIWVFWVGVGAGKFAINKL
jgi:hypothetical protein